jgi:hypothetical protein
MKCSVSFISSLKFIFCIPCLKLFNAYLSCADSGSRNGKKKETVLSQGAEFVSGNDSPAQGR